MTGINEDDKGNKSWMRAAGSVLILFILSASIILYYDWKRVLKIEMIKELPDYTGVTELFEKMMIGFVGGILVVILGKVVQKFFEKK